jgi:hypothetical protein
MTTFAELKALVVEQTKRPEVNSITEAAIRSATLRAHHVDFFPRDLVQASLPYTPSNNAVFYDFTGLSSTLLRLRSIQLLQSVDSVVYTPVEELEYRNLDDLYDSDGTLRAHAYTFIGDTMRAYPKAATGLFTCYYYQNPSVASTAYSSWIADTYPDELAMWAAAIVFARTGFAEMAADVQKIHILPFKETLIGSHLLGSVS